MPDYVETIAEDADPMRDEVLNAFVAAYDRKINCGASTVYADHTKDDGLPNLYIVEPGSNAKRILADPLNPALEKRVERPMRNAMADYQDNGIVRNLD